MVREMSTGAPFASRVLITSSRASAMKVLVKPLIADFSPSVNPAGPELLTVGILSTAWRTTSALRRLA